MAKYVRCSTNNLICFFANKNFLGYCAEQLNSTNTVANNCNVPCTYSPNEICGGASSILVYNATGAFYSNFTGPIGVGKPDTSGAYSFIGCYQWPGPGSSQPFIGISYQTSAGQSIDTCATYCAGYVYFGSFFFGRCFCGNNLNYRAWLQNTTLCNANCNGNASQICGSNTNGYSVYELTANVTANAVVTSSTVAAPAATV